MTTPARRSAWRGRAECAGADPALFDPPNSGPASMSSATRARLRVAQAVCAGCPVQVECLTEALEEGYSGVWGGVMLDGRRNYPAIASVSRRHLGAVAAADRQRAPRPGHA